MNSKISKFNNPKIFLIDALGAFLSIISLFFVYFFEDFFGMPKNTITVFICIATILFFYSTLIFLIKPKKWPIFLMLIASFNLCYCRFTIFHVIRFFEKLTIYGKLYFISEILIIISLSIFEFKLSNNSTKS